MTCATPPSTSLGIGTYGYALFAALVELSTQDHFRVVWDPSATGSRFGRQVRTPHPRVEWVETAEPALGWRAPFRTGALLRQLGGDVYLSPFFLRPVGAPMPVVLTLHDALHLNRESGSPLLTRLRFALALQFASGAEALITGSEFAVATSLSGRGFPRASCTWCPPGCRSDSPAKRFAPRVCRRGRSRWSWARIVRTRYLRTLARAWQQMGESPPLDLVAVGPLDPRFPSLAGMTAGGSVHELGSVSAAELEWLYTNAVLLVFPSLYEGIRIAPPGGCRARIARDRVRHPGAARDRRRRGALRTGRAMPRPGRPRFVNCPPTPRARERHAHRGLVSAPRTTATRLRRASAKHRS